MNDWTDDDVEIARDEGWARLPMGKESLVVIVEHALSGTSPTAYKWLTLMQDRGSESGEYYGVNLKSIIKVLEKDYANSSK